MNHVSQAEIDLSTTKTSAPRPEGLSVVIPCLNEIETIERAVAAAQIGVNKTGLPGEVVVADNGSTDGSQAAATAAGARVVPVAKRGYGAALDAGIRAARYEYVVFGDADLSYPLDFAAELILPLRNSSADLVLGTRLGGTIADGAMPLLNRHVGTPVLNVFIRVLHKLPTSDCNSGMRALRRSEYEKLQLACPGMEFASEMLVRAATHELRYAEVPIQFQKDQRNRPPHLKRWRDGWRHLRFILGHASAGLLIAAPAVAGTLLMVFAFILSFGFILGTPEKIHFHSAFVAIALAMPCLVFAATNLIVKFSIATEGYHFDGFLGAFQDFSDRAAPFYVAAFFYLLTALQIIVMTVAWAQSGFQDLFEIGGVVRMMVFVTVATLIFATDMATGLVRLGRP